MYQKVKIFLAKHFKSFYYFLSRLRHRIIFVMSLSIIVALLDGIGLSMFLPLLQLISNSDSVDGNSLGKMKVIVDLLNDSGLTLNLITILLVMMFFFLLKNVIGFISSTYLVNTLEYFVRKLRIEFVNTFNGIKYKFYVGTDTGRIQNIMTSELDRVSRAFQFYMMALQSAVIMIVYMVFAFLVDVQFALLVTAGGILTNLLYKMIYRRTMNLSVNYSGDTSAYHGQIIQYVTNFKYLKATATINRFAHHLNESIYRIEKLRRRMGMLHAVLKSSRKPYC